MLILPCALPGQALGADEMAVQCGAVVLGILALHAELVGEQRIASRGIDQKLRVPPLLPAVLVFGGDRDAVCAQIDIHHARALQAARAFLNAMLEQHLVELRAAHVIGIRIVAIPGLAELERDDAAMLRRGELGAVLVQSDALDLVLMPSFSNSSTLSGSSDSPMWNRGWRSFSTTTTSRPRSASRVAMVEPAGPPPTTNTSQWSGWSG